MFSCLISRQSHISCQFHVRKREIGIQSSSSQVNVFRKKYQRYNKTSIPYLFCLVSKLFTLGNILHFASLNINYLGWIISDIKQKRHEIFAYYRAAQGWKNKVLWRTKVRAAQTKLGECCAPRNCVLLVFLQGTRVRLTCFPHLVPRGAPNKIVYGKRLWTDEAMQ